MEVGKLHPKFDISITENDAITDAEIWQLLNCVYVEAGFTTASDAADYFAPSVVRQRGFLFAARERQSMALAGMVILVPSDSPACRMAKETEGEVHLLGVKDEYRGYGLGRMLMDALMVEAKNLCYSKLILWTQLPMTTAQRLYESLGFIYLNNMMRNGREFKVYEKELVGKPN